MQVYRAFVCVIDRAICLLLGDVATYSSMNIGGYYFSCSALDKLVGVTIYPANNNNNSFIATTLTSQLARFFLSKNMLLMEHECR